MKNDLILKEYVLNADYHTHTVYSHGKGHIIDNFLEAEKKGLRNIAITDHGLDHMVGVRLSDIPKMRYEIDEINAGSYSTKCYLGLEMNFEGIDGKIDYPKVYADMLDLVICGYHKTASPAKISDFFKIFLPTLIPHPFEQSERLKKDATAMHINAMKNNPIDIISHINRHIKLDLKEVAHVAEDLGVYLELSSRHADLSDDEYDILFNQSNVNFVVNSDAHKVENIGNIDYALSKIKEFNVNPDRFGNLNNNNLIVRSKGYKKI